MSWVCKWYSLVDIAQKKMVLERHPPDSWIIRGGLDWLPAGEDITNKCSGARDNQTESPGAALSWQGCLLCQKGESLPHLGYMTGSQIYSAFVIWS